MLVALARPAEEAGAHVSSNRVSAVASAASPGGSLHNFFTNKALLIPALIFPLFFFAAFAGGLSAISNMPGFDFPSGYTAFQFVFVLLQSAAFGGVFTGFGDRRATSRAASRRRLMLAAPHRTGIVLGYALRRSCRWLVTWTRPDRGRLVAGMKRRRRGVDLVGLYTLARS